jgi:hypothetical protein
METVYLVCALLGATLVVCQFLLSLVGLGHGHDFGGDAAGHDFGGHDVGHDAGHDASHGADHEHGHNAMAVFKWLTFRTISAAFAFFGLTGLSARRFDMDDGPALLLAMAAGGAALVVVSWLMQALGRLNVDGTARIERAVGSRGTVYLSIPGQRAGAGKVHVSCQDRLLEYKAVTSDGARTTGTAVVVVGVVSGDTVEVKPAPQPERLSHA